MATECTLLVIRRGHHAALYVGDTAVGKQDHDINALRAAEGFDGRAAGIARGCANDGRAPVLFGEEMIHEARQQLHGDVFERQRRTVEQFEDKGVAIDLNERRHGLMFEAA